MLTNPDPVHADLGTELAHVQEHLARADTKASILTGLALAALTGGAALVSKTHPHGLVLLALVVAGLLAGTALVSLGLAIRPNLHGDHGVVGWAAATDPIALGARLYREHQRPPADVYTDTVDHLWLMARSATTKYRRIGLAVDLLAAALLFAVIAYVVAAIG